LTSSKIIWMTGEVSRVRRMGKNLKCGNCGIVYSDNPDSCKGCGSTVLKRTDEDANSHLYDFDDEEEQINAEGLSEDVIMGKNVVNQEDDLPEGWNCLDCGAEFYWNRNHEDEEATCPDCASSNTELDVQNDAKGED
jgi:predicted Zn-ribbon and HTH transcriptional regulator